MKVQYKAEILVDFNTVNIKQNLKLKNIRIYSNVTLYDPLKYIVKNNNLLYYTLMNASLWAKYF